MKYDALLESIASLHASSTARAASVVNQALIMRNWVIGAYLVEFEQQGEDRAAYGEKLLPNLARDLAQRGVPGASRQMLDWMRSFYRTYPQIDAHIRSSAMSVLPRPDSMPRIEICSSPMSKSPSLLPATEILRMSWTHIIELLRSGVLSSSAVLSSVDRSESARLHTRRRGTDELLPQLLES